VVVGGSSGGGGTNPDSMADGTKVEVNVAIFPNLPPEIWVHILAYLRFSELGMLP